MAAAEEYVSRETLEQVSTESFAQNLANYRSLLLQWEREVEIGRADDKRARMIFREAAMLQEIIQGQMAGKGRELGVSPEAVQDVASIYRQALNKLALRIAADSKIFGPDADRFIEVIESIEKSPSQMKELATKLKLAKTSYYAIVSSPDSAYRVAPGFVKLLEDVVTLYRELGGAIPNAAPPLDPPKAPPTGGDGGGGSDLPRRVERLETKVDKMTDDISGIKSTLVRMEEMLKHAAMKSDVSRIDERLSHLPTKDDVFGKFMTLYIAGTVAVVGLATLIAKSAKWF